MNYQVIDLQHPTGYASFYTLAFLSSFIILILEGRRRKLRTLPWLIVIGTGFVFFVFGCRLITFSLPDWQAIIDYRPLDRETGLIMLGGLLFSVPAIFVVRRLVHLEDSIIDAYAFVLPLGMCIQRIGLRSRRNVVRSWLLLFLLISCEIEDDFGIPDISTFFGEKLYSSPQGIGPIVWSGGTNEIVSLNASGVIATNLSTKSNRELSFDPLSPDWESLRIAGNTLYFTNVSYELASVNLSSMVYTPSILDSVYTGYSLTFFADKYLAFGKFRPSDVGDPSLFLFDLATGKETYITSGIPYSFSPDGSQLLFTKENTYYTYNLQTKAIVAFGSPSGNVLRWTSAGIISYFQTGSSIRVFNETTRQVVGTWPSVDEVYTHTVSPSGNRVITLRAECAVPITVQGCSYPSYYYSVVDITSQEQFETIDSNYPIDMRVTFSPDEKKFAYIKDNTIYVTSEPE